MHRAALVALLFATAAFVPGGEPALVTTGKPVRVQASTTSATPARAQAAFAPLAQSGWQALWDRDTGVPLRLSGGYVDVPGSVADPAIAERAARDFLASHLDLLAPGAAITDFALAGDQLDHTGVRTVGFTQTSHGLRVVGGQVGFVFAHDHLFAIGSEALPEIHVAIPAAHAVDVRATERWIRGAAARPTGERVILPLIRAGDVQYAVVDVVDATAHLGAWDVYVGAGGTPIARASRLRFDSTATAAFNAGVRYATGTRMDFPAPELDLTANGVATTTAVDGTFSFTGATADVVPSVGGLRVTIQNQAGALATTALSTTPGGTATWNAMDDEFTDAQLDTYIYGNLIKARDRIINPDIASWIDQPLDFFVNENDTCNAYSTGNDVHFFRLSSMCQNTGRIADVVFHEFGHSFHFHTLIPGMGVFDTSLSEGLADFNAANMTGDSGIGRGFDFTDNALREIDPVGTEASYPEDLSDDPHVNGMIISGALWDFRKAAILAFGQTAGVALAEKLFTGVAARAANIQTSYTAALIADDDDGNLGNGTPHQCMIATAFAPHGLVDNFVTTSIGAPTIAGYGVTLPVTQPQSTTCPPAGVTSATLTWQVAGGAPNDVALTMQGGNLVGSIPAQPDFTLVTFSIAVQLDNGTNYAFPDNLADPKYQMFTGVPTPLYCANMDVDPKWTQTSLHGVQWEWAPPGLSPSSTDPLVAHTGVKVLGLNLDFGGNYLSNEDTKIETDTFDLSSYEHVHLQFWRWLTVERGMYDTATVTANGTPVWSNAMMLDHLDKEWRFQDIDLTGMPSAKLGWTLTSDDSTQYGGWTLDDVCLVYYPKIPVCGDGVLDAGEGCDDGNTVDGDGCSATCAVEMHAAAAGCCSADRDPSGALVLGLGMIVLGHFSARRRRLALRSGRRRR